LKELPENCRTMCEVSDQEFIVSNLLHATNASPFWFYKLFVMCWQMWIQSTHMSDRRWRSTELPENLRPLFTSSSQVKTNWFAASLKPFQNDWFTTVTSHLIFLRAHLL
jgi:hypothetical protein